MSGRRGATTLLSAAVLLMVGVLVATFIGASTPSEASHGGPRHWARDGLARAQIYFVDHTPAAWPVATATYRWNEASGVDSYYQTSCPNSRVHCVHVRQYTASSGSPTQQCKKAYGCTTFGSSTTRHYPNGSVKVYLNETTVAGAAQHRKTTCHELGHALGLGHRFDNDSCMTQGQSPPIRQYPSLHDYNALKSLYNHSN